ncbi:MAG TPA: protein-disulfide reductase DsbD domain-containing protein [Myxococcota bacterium]|nr:protein-disulfide reductase DsbD domain-containing protein [Myxococcota bacterium]
MRSLSSWLLLIMLAGGCSCQKRSLAKREINFDESYNVSAHYEKHTSIVRVDVALKDGVHAYAPKETIGKPVRLSIAPDNGWKAVGEPSIPEGTKKSLGSLGDSYVLSGNFSIVQAVSPGSDGGKAILHLQVCTDTQCDRPRTLEMPFR